MVLEALSTQPDDTDFDHQWALHNTGASPHNGEPDADIDAPEGWDFETEKSTVLLAILDSGLPYDDSTDQLTHPDLDAPNRYIIGIDGMFLPPRFASRCYRNDPPDNLEWLAYKSVIAVAAINKDDEQAHYSSYNPGYEYISLAAPGGEGISYDGILSLFPNYTSFAHTDSMGYLWGTSMAAPMVSGLAALIWERFDQEDAEGIRTILENSAEDVNSDGFDEELGHGRINVYYALAPPATPQNLTIDGDVGENPLLEWDANEEPDLEEYNIYKKEGAGNWFQIGTVDVPDTQWTDVSCEIGTRFDPLVYYQVKAEDFTEQESAASNTVFTRVEGINKRIDEYAGLTAEIPTIFTLKQVYPNPFNPSTTIQYALPKTSDVLITVYDLLGRTVWSYEEVAQSPGLYSIRWNGLNDSGKQVASGIYLISFSTPEFRAVQKAVLIR